ncbi:uncharacterized protein AB675_5349 [Cyphellophora attinorum]|uniref:HMG box domain-containing protein n=1 Tax=Cyphellophora attinorum TaxID=1664694 RepID=A0A0N1H701_9EURO|nr:uncharacterized protein AB675_5349 [Phialophora attinorum]KPI42026.1 hypothetical protein AB675_5349 [Phialophora attinorum]
MSVDELRQHLECVEQGTLIQAINLMCSADYDLYHNLHTSVYAGNILSVTLKPPSTSTANLKTDPKKRKSDYDATPAPVTSKRFKGQVPRRPKAPYALYMQSARCHIARSLGVAATSPEVAAEGTRIWQTMPQAEKVVSPSSSSFITASSNRPQVWEGQYQKRLAEYRVKMAAYEADHEAPVVEVDATIHLENCSCCGAVFNINDQKAAGCEYHPGDLYFEDELVRDLRIDAAKIFEMMRSGPEHFDWSCCYMSGEYKGCTKAVRHSIGVLSRQVKLVRGGLKPLKTNPRAKHCGYGQHRGPVKDSALSDVTDDAESSAVTYASDSEDDRPGWWRKQRVMDSPS